MKQEANLDLPTRLANLGLSLPPAPKPVAAYVPAVVTGDLVCVSGQLPLVDGQLVAVGPVPSVVSEAQAAVAARQCVLNALAIVGEVIDGDWSRLARVVRVGIFVQCDARYGGQPQVANGASQLLEQLFAEAGRHARAAVGVNALPLDASVELEMAVELVGNGL